MPNLRRIARNAVVTELACLAVALLLGTLSSGPFELALFTVGALGGLAFVVATVSTVMMAVTRRSWRWAIVAFPHVALILAYVLLAMFAGGGILPS